MNTPGHKKTLSGEGTPPEQQRQHGGETTEKQQGDQTIGETIVPTGHSGDTIFLGKQQGGETDVHASGSAVALGPTKQQTDSSSSSSPEAEIDTSRVQCPVSGVQTTIQGQPKQSAVSGTRSDIQVTQQDSDGSESSENKKQSTRREKRGKGETEALAPTLEWNRDQGTGQ